MKLNFPSVHIQKLYGEFDFYGANNVLSKYLNVKFIDKKKYNIAYTHGWKPDYFLNSDPRIIYSHSFLKKNHLIFVARESIKKYLISQGYTNVHSIGMPVVYLPEKKYRRIPNSLLIMPSHSLDYTKHNHWKFKEYVEEIKKIKHHFKEVFICIHPSCIKKNYWVNEFKEAGFNNIITGIDIRDINALFRLKKMMESFEFVTTNGFGSHLAYAAFFGAKISIYGSYNEYKKEDFADDPYFINNPEILEKSLELYSENIVKYNYSELFKEPHMATTNTEWGKYEVGFYDKRNKKNLINLFQTINDSLIHRVTILDNFLFIKKRISKYLSFKFLIRKFTKSHNLYI